MRAVPVRLLILGGVLWLGVRGYRCVTGDQEVPEYGFHGEFKRSLFDPRVAHISGTVVHEGRSVGSARVEATVYPTGMGWTVDEATTNAIGTFSMPITSNHLNERQLVELDVRAGTMSGTTTLMVEPGEVVKHLTIEVGVGVTVSGGIIDGD